MEENIEGGNNRDFDVTFFDIAKIESLEPGDNMLSEDGSFSVIFYSPYYTFIFNGKEYGEMRDFANIDSILTFLGD